MTCAPRYRAVLEKVKRNGEKNSSKTMDSDFLDALPALYARFQAERAALTGQIPGASHPIAADLDLNLSDMMSLPLPSSGPPATDQPTGEPASDPTQYSAEEYLSKSRKFTTAKKHFRVIETSLSLSLHCCITMYILF